MAKLVLNNISKNFGETKALDNVSLEIDEGSIVCLLGPPGGGKTTLLKIIAGLEKPDTGNVYFGDEDVTGFPPNKRDVSMVFQDFALYPHMTVFKNIASPLYAKKLSAAEIKKKVEEVARFLRIDRFLERKVTQLSGGEMQRVAIGRALAKEARIVLFDEIFVNLDYKLREEMRVEFKDLVDRLNITTIISSPDPEDALSLAHMVAVIHEGVVLQYDLRDTVYQRPADVFTGSYFGYPEMNLIDCTVARKNGGLVIDSEPFKLPIKSKGKGSDMTPGDYVLGIRPENISIGKQSSERDAVKGKMILTEVIGSDTIVHVLVGNQTLQSFVPGIYRNVSDEAVYVGFDPDDVYVFRKDTGAFETRGI